MVRLTRLKIDRFRNVKPGTDLRFGPTFNVLLGKNATGKSTLLDVIAAVTNDDLSTFADEEAGYDLTWWLEGGEDQFEMRAQRVPAVSRSLLEGVREARSYDDTWTMLVRRRDEAVGRIDVAGARVTWTPRGDRPESFEIIGGFDAGELGQRALLAAANGRRSLSDAAFGAVSAVPLFFGTDGKVGRLDEGLATFNDITNAHFALGSDGTGALTRWLPRDFAPVARRVGLTEGALLGLENLEGLSDIPVLLGFLSAQIQPKLLKRTQNGPRFTVFYQGFDCIFRRLDGSEITHQLLSFGQKRLFTFLWYLAVRESLPTVADELFNGLHHEWIRVCIDRLHDRQSFLATHDPLLLDHIPIASAAAVQTTFVRCALETTPDGPEQMAWRNFTEEEAERFFVAYETGIQHVSEVLRSEGLW